MLNNIDPQIYYVEVPRRKLQIVDKLVELSKNSSTVIQNQKDWDIVIKLFEFFKYEFPQDYADYEQSIQNLRRQHNFGNAIVKEKGAMVQHQLEIPQKFAELIWAIFPDQKFDRDFVRGLSKNLPILKVADKI